MAVLGLVNTHGDVEAARTRLVRSLYGLCCEYFDYVLDVKPDYDCLPYGSTHYFLVTFRMYCLSYLAE